MKKIVSYFFNPFIYLKDKKLFFPSLNQNFMQRKDILDETKFCDCFEEYIFKTSLNLKKNVNVARRYLKRKKILK